MKFRWRSLNLRNARKIVKDGTGKISFIWNAVGLTIRVGKTRITMRSDHSIVYLKWIASKSSTALQSGI